MVAAAGAPFRPQVLASALRRSLTNSIRQASHQPIRLINARAIERTPAVMLKPARARLVPRAPYAMSTSIGGVAAAVLALAADAVMLADAAAQTLLARAPDAVMLADAAAQALLALAPDAVMFAYLRSPAFLAQALLALVGSYARPQALLARAPFAVMLADAAAQAQLVVPLIKSLVPKA